MEEERTLFVARNELKYILDLQTASRLKNLLDTQLERDAYSADGSYQVKSLYFDTWMNSDFQEKMAGEEIRKKVRLRIYDESDQSAKLEIKAKQGNFQHKYSLQVTREESVALMNGQYSFLLDREEETAALLYRTIMTEGYGPKAVITYNRTAFVYPLNNTRITIDQDIRGSETSLDLFDRELPYLYAEPGTVILEVKYNGKLASSIQKILRHFPLNNVSYSKYCNGRKLLQELMF